MNWRWPDEWPCEPEERIGLLSLLLIGVVVIALIILTLF